MKKEDSKSHNVWHSDTLESVVNNNLKEKARITTLFRSHLKFLKEVNEFKENHDDWQMESEPGRRRLRLLGDFVPIQSQKFSELCHCDHLRKFLDISTIKTILSKQEHADYSINEHQSNPLLKTQGLVLRNFLYLYIRRDFRFKDSIDSMNIEYNNPFQRQRIREHNRSGFPIKKKFLT
jgi:hypothetical protein